MWPGDHHAGSSSTPYGAGFRYGSNSTNAPPCLPPPEQMTPEQKKAVLMAAGRLAAEHLVSIGKLPPHVLWNRPRPPPPPRWFQERPHAPQHEQSQHEQLFQQGGRPLAKPQFRYQQGPPRRFAPRAFQDRPITKRPRPQPPRTFQRCPPPPRPFPSGGRGGAAPPKTGWCIGQGAVPVQDEPASGDGSNRQQPVPQSGGAGAAESPKTADQR